MRLRTHHTSKTARNDALRPLTALKGAESGVVQELHGGACFRNRLAALGFTPGVLITMLQNRRHGPVLVTLRDTRIALGRGEAHRILVRPAQGKRC